VAGGRVAGLPLDLSQGVFETFVLERLDLAAAVADQVVVMVAAGMSRLEPRDRVADLDALDKALVGEKVEDPVDARDPDATTLGS